MEGPCAVIISAAIPSHEVEVEVEVGSEGTSVSQDGKCPSLTPNQPGRRV